VIDADYRGNVGVVLFNFGSEDFAVSKGDRIAQLILERIFTPAVAEVDDLVGRSAAQRRSCQLAQLTFCGRARHPGRDAARRGRLW